ncbi:hypothetical protein PPROV_000224300 [Pycnococcus provasolii]|uniref:Uncharacterized protein n=1 Tax=Pycnococcus provasolii TaxID=41880 RepID=A0A830H9U1_9CHLO|nr:hypothetical protein PPROV_000224300 [Pycnococcus provasolii]
MSFEMQRARVAMGDRRTSKPNYRTSADTTAGGVVPRLSVENLGNQGNQRRQQRALSVPNVATMYHRTSTGGARVSDSGRSLMVGPASGSNGFMDESEVARARASAASRGRRKSYAGSGGVLSSMTMMDQPGVDNMVDGEASVEAGSSSCGGGSGGGCGKAERNTSLQDVTSR